MHLGELLATDLTSTERLGNPFSITRLRPQLRKPLCRLMVLPQLPVHSLQTMMQGMPLSLRSTTAIIPGRLREVLVTSLDSRKT